MLRKPGIFRKTATEPPRPTEAAPDELTALRAQVTDLRNTVQDLVVEVHRLQRRLDQGQPAAPASAALPAVGQGTAPPTTKVAEAPEASIQAEAFWGQVDNESARARAAGDTLIIDQWECIACGTCVENADSVFALPDDHKAAVLAQEGPMELIQDAIDACPVTCIHWTDEPDQFEQINDAEGKPLA